MTRKIGLYLIVFLGACSTNPGDLTTESAPGGTGLADPAKWNTDPAELALNEEAQTQAEVDPDYDPSKDLALTSCGAHEVLDLVGTPLADGQTRLPEDARVIRPGDLVSQDYDTKRMNVFVTEGGKITKINCG